jgi:hypothetical protein
VVEFAASEASRDPADVNRDGKVDTADLLYVKAWIPQSTATTVPASLPSGPAGEIILTPESDWRSRIAAAQPGDVFLLRGGVYKPVPGDIGLNYRAALMIGASGQPGKPITLKAAAGEKVIFDGTGVTYAIRIGDMVREVPSRHIILDGLHAIGADRTGIIVWRGDHVEIRNCHAYDNNASGTKGKSYFAAIELAGTDDAIVERCRVYHNACGIQGTESDLSTNPIGCHRCVVRDNFVYGNAWSGNLNNSAGIGFRFGERCTIDNNIMWDNPDSAINGLGNVLCTVTRNACLNAWQSGGNNEGLKLCVRGGGGNLIAGNILAFNGNRGYDACEGVGDLFLHNTVYGNGGWGVLAEGAHTFLFNNIIAQNAVGVGLEFREVAAEGASPISDYNWFGQLPIQIASSAHQWSGDPGLPKAAAVKAVLVRKDPQQVVHPESLFEDKDKDGKVTIEEARAWLAARFAPGSNSKARGAGLKLSQVRARVAGAVPQLVAELDARIAHRQANAAGNVQWLQSVSMYKRLKEALQKDGGTGPDLARLQDFSGKPVPDAPCLGAAQ